MVKNLKIANFCDEHGISHEFYAPRTQNGVVERKNRTLQEMARVMLNSKKLAFRLWAETINTACYTINCVNLRPGTTKTPYEIWKGKKSNLSYFHVFGCICYILNDRDHLGKFDAKSDESVFLGYSTNNRAYHVNNMRTQTIMESANVTFDGFKDFSEFSKEQEIFSFIDKAKAQVSKRQVLISMHHQPTFLFQPLLQHLLQHYSLFQHLLKHLLGLNLKQLRLQGK